ncbi:MAG TPA: TrmH family RNA methyltransferase [Rhodothermales bacterium]|nr:TrmH family RNA methyltransferase [Rhodothermales bacterium]
MRKLKHEEIPRPAPDEVAALPKHPIVVVLDDIRSIYNVGSIFRTSDAAQIEHLYLTGITGTPENRGLHKTALGAQDTVAWTYEQAAEPVIERLKADGYTIAVLEITDTPTRTTDVQAAHFPLCLILGNEVTGVRDDLIALADLALEIPQFGAKQSLNVAVAYGIAVFDLVRCFREFQIPS